MRQLRQWIRLVHELTQLRPPKEIAHHGAQSFRIDQLLRRHALQIDIKQRHPLFHQTLRPSEAQTTLIGQQFTHGTHTTAAQVINIIKHPIALLQLQEILHGGQEIDLRHDALIAIDIQSKLLVQLVTANPCQIVLLRIEEQSFQQGTRIGHRRWITRAQTLVDVLQRFFFR